MPLTQQRKIMGVHVNSIHVTSPSECFVLAVDMLAGDTANDYATHIDTSIDQVYFIYLHIFTYLTINYIFRFQKYFLLSTIKTNKMLKITLFRI